MLPPSLPDRPRSQAVFFPLLLVADTRRPSPAAGNGGEPPAIELRLFPPRIISHSTRRSSLGRRARPGGRVGRWRRASLAAPSPTAACSRFGKPLPRKPWPRSGVGSGGERRRQLAAAGRWLTASRGWEPSLTLLCAMSSCRRPILGRLDKDAAKSVTCKPPLFLSGALSGEKSNSLQRSPLLPAFSMRHFPGIVPRQVPGRVRVSTMFLAAVQPGF